MLTSGDRFLVLQISAIETHHRRWRIVASQIRWKIDPSERAHLHAVFNTFEAVLWAVVAITIAWHLRAAKRSVRLNGAAAAIAFAAFSLSDVVEIQTGAWYRPPWLLVWKTACIVVLLACYVRYRQSHRVESHRSISS